MLEPNISYSSLTNAENAWVTSGAAGVLKLLETTAPTEESGLGLLYVKSSDSDLYFKDDSGVETNLLTLIAGGITNINGLTTASQLFATAETGSDISITSAGSTHTINLPIASGTNTGKLSNTNWSTFNNKLGTALASGYIFVGNSSGAATGVAMSSDVTISNTGVTTIANSAVTYAKIQNVSATDKLLGRSSVGAGVIEEITCTSAGRAVIDDATTAAQRTTLGLAIGTDVQAYDAQLTDIAGLSPASSSFIGSNASNLIMRTAAQTKSDLGLVIGTNIQAWDTDLDAIAALAQSGSAIIMSNGATWIARSTANVVSDLNLVIGTNTQAFDAQLSDIAALVPASSAFIGSNSSNLILRTAAQARGDLALVVGTNVQAWNTTLDTVAAGTYAGDDSITTVGTIVSGTWTGTDIALADGGTGQSLTDPNADRIMFWDDSAGKVDWLVVGTALTVSGTAMLVSGTATLTAQGIVEMATAAETTTGTDAFRAVSPDSLADSNYGQRIVQVLMTDPNATAQGAGTGTSYVRIDSTLNGFRLVGMEMGIAIGSASAGGGISVTPRNLTKAYDMVSTPVWIDSAESDSITAATAVVIVAGSASVATGDKIRLTIGGTGTATGIIASMIYQL